MSAVYVNQLWPDYKGVTIPNACISRKVDLPDTWKMLGIGILCNLTTGSNASLTGTPRLTIGLSSGTASIGDSYVKHFYGIITNTATLTWVSSSTSYYSLTTLNEYKIINNTASIGNDMEGATMYIHTDEDKVNNRKCVLYLVVDRAAISGSHSLRLLRPNVAATFTGSDDVTFKQILQSQTPTVTSHGFNTTTSENIDEANGKFDHINISWNRETPLSELLVYEVGVSLLESL